jgi:hypothetical protein
VIEKIFVQLSARESFKSDVFSWAPSPSLSISSLFYVMTYNRIDEIKTDLASYLETIGLFSTKEIGPS